MKTELVIHINGDSIVIDDRSHRNQRGEVLKKLKDSGLKTEVVFDSPCG
jgi:hypothetical protein